MKNLFKTSMIALFVGSMLFTSTSCKKKKEKVAPVIDRTITFDGPFNWKVVGLRANEDGSQNKQLKNMSEVMVVAYTRNNYANFVPLPTKVESNITVTYEQDGTGIVTFELQNGYNNSYPFNGQKSMDFRFVLIDLAKAKMIKAAGQDVRTLTYEEALKYTE